MRSDDHNVTLQLVPKSNPVTDLEKDLPSTLAKAHLPTPGPEEQVWRDCGWDPRSPDNRLFPLAVPLIGAAVDYILGAVSDSVAADIAKYQAGFSATVSAPFYAKRVIAYKCFRFSRYELDSAGNRTLALDLLAQFDAADDYMKIVPLRLYYGKPKAESETTTNEKGEKTQLLALGITLDAKAIWRQDNEGRNAQLLSAAPLLAISCNLANGPVLWYRTAPDAKDAPCRVQQPHPASSGTSDALPTKPLTDLLAPLPPYSVPSGDGLLQLTVTAAELGAPPKYLCALSNALKGQKSSIESAITGAIDAKLGATSSSASKAGSSGAGGSGGSSGGSSGTSGTSASKSTQGAAGSSQNTATPCAK